MEVEQKHRLKSLSVVIVGITSLIWVLLRVLPKPTRATYPCQRIAIPLALSFIPHFSAMVISLLAFHKIRRCVRPSLYLATCLFIVAGILAVGWSFFTFPADSVSADFTPNDLSNQPIGMAKGINPGRVVWVHDPEATSWDGMTGYWWEDINTNQMIVDGMFSEALRYLTDAPTDGEAWQHLFQYFNLTHNRGNDGYTAGEKVAIKINLNNQQDYTSEDNHIDASPQTVLALLRQLVNQAGVQESMITVYDATRLIPDKIFEPCHSEFSNVRFVDAAGENGRIQTVWVPDVMHYSNGESNSAARKVPQSVIEADYLINLAILKRHGLVAPTTLCGKNNFGSIGGPASLHPYLSSEGMLGYDPEVDLMGHEHLGGKTMLFLIDGLYGGRNLYSIGEKWSTPPFNNDWPSSLFVSQDGVAIDSVAVDFLRMEMFSELPPNTDNYLHEAAQADDPPSGIFYDPEGDGSSLTSLGVHEHWNNTTDKQYTRNLETGYGIELIFSNNHSSSDVDHDGIFEDGDNSGMPGDNPCTAGITENCDDNCPNISNPDQLDTYPPQGNGIGDACDCESDYNCDGNVDAIDLNAFLGDFARSILNNPCTNADPCNGDVNCDVNVDATDVIVFLQDFGRSQFNNLCPPCETGNWCVYP